MAAQIPQSPSPFQPAPPLHPSTPIHSPHHSLASTASSRTPVHTLSIREYRKQQSTPTPSAGTPPGRTLRRKAAASALNELERVPSVSRSSGLALRPPFRPLHLSQSAQHLAARQNLPPSPPHLFPYEQSQEQPPRSYSADLQTPRATSFRYPSTSEAAHSQRSFDIHTIDKVSNWKPIKRLPKPNPSVCLYREVPTRDSTPSLNPVTLSRRPQLPPLRINSASPSEDLPSETRTTPSTFSFSRFPHPPHLLGPSLSPPNDESIPPLNTSFATAALATPPATPAIVHYRGTSFDLVNPHDSLLFHDIETPTRDLDSSEHLPFRSSADPRVEVDTMALKRPLYGDLSSAHSSIRGQAGNPPSVPSLPSLDLPLPPVPAALSPESSQYSSPGRSQDPSFAVSPLNVQKKDAQDSRFSLKQLTRSLTRKLGKTGETEGEELQPMPIHRVDATAGHSGNAYPRLPDQIYQTAPVTSPSDAEFSFGDYETGTQYDSLQQDNPAQRQYRFSSAPLASMIPEPSSTSEDHGGPLTSVSEGGIATRPWYEQEDWQSIAQGSSIYGSEQGSAYPPSLNDKRRSNAFDPLDYVDDDDDDSSRQNQRTSLYSYAPSVRISRRVSRPTQDLLRRSVLQGQLHEKTDTISNFIGHYDNENTGPSSLRSPETSRETTSSNLPSSPRQSTAELASIERPRAQRLTSGISQFDFNFATSSNLDEDATPPPFQNMNTQQHANVRPSGSPPQTAAPLAPAFEYAAESRNPYLPQNSEMFSGASSYGDTRLLLQLSQPLSTGLDVTSNAQTSVTSVLGPALKPSSSYSQSDGQSGPLTPQEALEQADRIFGQADALNKADQIFQEAAARSPRTDIPAMWSRRGSGNLLRNRISTGSASEAINSGDDDKGDWETIVNDSGTGRPSLDDGDSIADYSSTDDDEDALEAIPESSFATVGTQGMQRDSSMYHHPSPLGSHVNPFRSSPPALIQSGNRIVSEHASMSPPHANPPTSGTTTPLFAAKRGVISSEAWDRGFQKPPFLRFNQELEDNEEQDMLNSGPNDEILYEDPHPLAGMAPRHSVRMDLPTSGSLSTSPEDARLQRENTFEKLSTLGPKGNLTGSPQGTGMHEAGSSLANTSSPGARFSSSPYTQNEYRGFYMEPGRRSSMNRVQGSHLRKHDDDEHERTPSQVTLFPSHYRMESLSSQGSNPSISNKSAQATRKERRRSAVHGQTKLRNMLLSTDNHTLSSVNSEKGPRFMGTALDDRPSSSNTESPLRPAHHNRNLSSRNVGTLKTIDLEADFSPHLLCPERAIDPAEEAERKQKSWIIFMLFCLLPPAIILFRWVGDSVIVTLTGGRLGHVSEQPKKIAPWVWVTVNGAIVVAIVVGVIVAHSRATV
ncbi:hypothetical protein EJ04DRAFT_574812 [Polyplosphaeria fusca]|uniref:Uncharacterized protein n=1 Tax=Polyplosphaeria fusca TaxID=682080 RepID=A0A9P4V3Y7_9PLEO|nr:hypothetical protein EJ04DRAFT_574812 [Polyplosphaeria fusca]